VVDYAFKGGNTGFPVRAPPILQRGGFTLCATNVSGQACRSVRCRCAHVWGKHFARGGRGEASPSLAGGAVIAPSAKQLGCHRVMGRGVT
jgi:hypothetical protein